MTTAYKRLLLATALAGMFPLAAQAEDASTEARMHELERQLQTLSRELAAMREQLAAAPAAPAPTTAADKSQTAAQAENKGSPVYAAFKDGVSLQDDSGNWKLAINGRVQADYRHFSPDGAAADTFSLRRARLGGTLTFYKDYVVRVEGEYSGSSTVLTYGYIDINTLSAAKLRIGQFKPSYGLERSMSTNFIDFQERSLADALLGGTFDRGIMLHGAPVKGIYYSAAYVNGNNTDESDVEYDNKDAMARLTANIASFAGWHDSVLHVGGFYGKGQQESGSAIPALQTEARGYRFFETTASNKFSEPVDRTRDGVELAWAHGPVKLQSEYIRADFDGDGFDRNLSAWYASANWLVTGESFAAAYKEGVFGRIRPKSNFQPNGGGWGALQLGIRYSSFDGDDFLASNAVGTGRLAASKINEADAWTLGANWILNPNVRLVANYVHTRFDDMVMNNGYRFDDEDALTMRAQFDF